MWKPNHFIQCFQGNHVTTTWPQPRLDHTGRSCCVWQRFSTTLAPLERHQQNASASDSSDHFWKWSKGSNLQSLKHGLLSLLDALDLEELYIYIIIYKIMYMDCSEPTSKLCVRTNARTYEWNLPCRSIVPMAAMAPGNAPRPRIRRQDKPLTFIMVLVLVTPSPQVAKKRWTLSWLYHCRVSSVF